MKISALDLKKQIAPIRPELDSAIKEIIDSTSFILGAGVDRFERRAAEYSGAKYAVGVSNGTDAISLALLALGIKAGDGVICPAFTYYATAGAVANIGARPVFADIDKKTYNLSPESVEKILSRKSKFKIKAIVPVHLYGACAEMGGIVRLARKYKIKIIEDNAQSFGAEYKGQKAGTLGDCGTVSFYPGKNLGAFGDAGMVLTNNKETAEKLKILRNQGNEDRYYHIMLGRNNRLDTLQAAVLEVKLKYLDSWNKARQEVARYYDRNLSGLNILLPVIPAYSTHVYNQYVIRTPLPNKLFLEHMQAKGIDARIFYPLPLHLQKCFKYLGYKTGDFPEGEKAAKQTLALPIYPDLTKEEKDYIIQSIKEFIGGK